MLQYFRVEHKSHRVFRRVRGYGGPSAAEGPGIMQDDQRRRIFLEFAEYFAASFILKQFLLAF
jgi:hypothetical protein